MYGPVLRSADAADFAGATSSRRSSQTPPLIEAEEGFTLTDAGFPDKEAAVFGAIRKLGRPPDQLST